MKIDNLNGQLSLKTSETSQGAFEFEEYRKRNEREIASLRTRLTNADEETGNLRARLREEVEMNRDIVKTKNLNFDLELKTTKEYQLLFFIPFFLIVFQQSLIMTINY